MLNGDRAADFVSSMFREWDEPEEIPLLVCNTAGTYRYNDNKLKKIASIGDIEETYGVSFDGIFLNAECLPSDEIDSEFIAVSRTSAAKLPRVTHRSIGHILTEKMVDRCELESRFPSLLTLLEHLPQVLTEAFGLRPRPHLRQSLMTAKRLSKQLEDKQTICMRLSHLTEAEEAFLQNRVAQRLPVQVGPIANSMVQRYIVSGMGFMLVTSKISDTVPVNCNIGDFVWISCSSNFSQLSRRGFGVILGNEQQVAQNVLLLEQEIGTEVDLLTLPIGDLEDRFEVTAISSASLVRDELRYATSGGSVNWRFDRDTALEAAELFEKLAKALEKNIAVTIALPKQ